MTFNPRSFASALLRSLVEVCITTVLLACLNGLRGTAILLLFSVACCALLLLHLLYRQNKFSIAPINSISSMSINKTWQCGGSSPVNNCGFCFTSLCDQTLLKWMVSMANHDSGIEYRRIVVWLVDFRNWDSYFSRHLDAPLRLR